MSIRGIIIGLALAVLIGAFGYVNDQVLLLESVTSGTLLPISVFAILFVGVLFINPLLGLLWRRLRFRPAEIAWIVGDLLGGATFMAVGGIYHALTGLAPIKYIIFTR